MKGIFSALLVSFDSNGNINESGLREIINHNIDVCKVDGLYVGGSTGENFMLSTEEKKKVFKITKEEVKERVTLIAQVGSINVKESVELAKYVTELGYNAISAVTPFYYKFDFNEIKDYYNTIINSVDNKMIIYSIPFLTGVNLSVEQFAELFENPKIVGIKFTADDFYLLERVRDRFKDKLIYAGFDEMLLPATVLGVDGAIGSTYNINGNKAKKIFKLANEGKISEARKLQSETNDLITELLSNGIYNSLKLILSEMGVDAGYCRKPIKLHTEDQISRAKSIYKKFFSI